MVRAAHHLAGGMLMVTGFRDEMFPFAQHDTGESIEFSVMVRRVEQRAGGVLMVTAFRDEMFH